VRNITTLYLLYLAPFSLLRPTRRIRFLLLLAHECVCLFYINHYRAIHVYRNRCNHESLHAASSVLQLLLAPDISNAVPVLNSSLPSPMQQPCTKRRLALCNVFTIADTHTFAGTYWLQSSLKMSYSPKDGKSFPMFNLAQTQTHAHISSSVRRFRLTSSRKDIYVNFCECEMMYSGNIFVEFTVCLICLFSCYVYFY
jgi:hypothetical protein